MATDDCYEIGRGPCPCGKGIITVEKCIPDHPWAKESQASYTPALVCEVCGPKYGFLRHDWLTSKSRLVLRDELEKHKDAEEKWHRKLREIEASSAFKELAQRLDQLLATAKSAAARHRLLSAAGLARTLSLGRYRRHGYHLSALDVSEAMKLVRMDTQELAQMAKEAGQLAEEMHHEVRAIKTGITGLEK
jgi:hypothetical protein